MKNSSPVPPTLKPSSRCVNVWDFKPTSHWPKGLPGVSINNVQIAGFGQDLVLDHQINVLMPDQILELFTSLYSDLSVTELNRLHILSKDAAWFPFEKISQHYRVLADSKPSVELSNLPWPGASIVRWTQQGDQAGIEIKFFVSNPTDLKNNLKSLNQVHDILEKDSEKLWIKH
jgi:hypothetical protein